MIQIGDKQYDETKFNDEQKFLLMTALRMRDRKMQAMAAANTYNSEEQATMQELVTRIEEAEKAIAAEQEAAKAKQDSAPDESEAA